MLESCKVSDAFDPCNVFTLSQEGGRSNDPRDPGGATNQGLTLPDLRHWDRDATVDDLWNMPNDLRDALYRALYWTPVRGWALWPGLDLMVYDHGVNCGVLCSTRLLQELLHVTADGVLGPVTAQAARAVLPADRAALVANLNTAQANDYRTKRNFDVFGHGWLNRCAARKAAALQLMGAAA